MKCEGGGGLRHAQYVYVHIPKCFHGEIVSKNLSLLANRPNFPPHCSINKFYP